MRNCSINRAIRRELIIRQNDKIQINPNQYRDICRKRRKRKEKYQQGFQKGGEMSQGCQPARTMQRNLLPQRLLVTSHLKLM